jgi:hypothetical protein
MYDSDFFIINSQIHMHRLANRVLFLYLEQKVATFTFRSKLDIQADKNSATIFSKFEQCLKNGEMLY